MTSNNYVVEFNGIKIKVIGAQGFESILNDFYLRYSFNDEKYDYTLSVELIENFPYKQTHESKTISGMGGASYVKWLHKENIIIQHQSAMIEYLIEHAGNYLTIYIKKDYKTQVNLYLSRLCREIFYRNLLNNYIPLHASCVTRDDKAIIFFGKKGRGKTTSFITLIKNFGYKPVSNDIIFVKENENNLHTYEIIGFPFKVAIGNSFLDKLPKSIETYEKLGDKVLLKPREFCENLDTAWVWKSYLNKICIPNIQLDIQSGINILASDKVYRLLLEEGIEKKDWHDYLEIQKNHDDQSHIIKKISKNITSWELFGNISEVNEKNIKALLN